MIISCFWAMRTAIWQIRKLLTFMGTSWALLLGALQEMVRDTQLSYLWKGLITHMASGYLMVSFVKNLHCNLSDQTNGSLIEEREHGPHDPLWFVLLILSDFPILSVRKMAEHEGNRCHSFHLRGHLFSYLTLTLVSLCISGWSQTTENEEVEVQYHNAP